MILYVLFQNAPAIATKRKHFKLCHHKKKSAVSFIDQKTKDGKDDVKYMLQFSDFLYKYTPM